MMRRIAAESLSARPEPVALFCSRAEPRASTGTPGAPPVFARAPEGALRPAPESAPADPALHGAQLARALVALLGEELHARPEHVRSVVERELLRMRRARHILLRAHPLDLALLESADALRAKLELGAALTLRADAGLERGGCVLESELGEVDARLETRLALALALLQSGLV